MKWERGLLTEGLRVVKISAPSVRLLVCCLLQRLFISGYGGVWEGAVEQEVSLPCPGPNARSEAALCLQGLK